MAKLTSGRIKKLPQSGITSDRYEFLGLEQAEPDLGNPLVGPSSIGAKPYPQSGDAYVLLSFAGQSTEANRYWVLSSSIPGLGLLPGAVTIRDEGNLIGAAKSFFTLNFVGDPVSVDYVGPTSQEQTGIATIRISPVGYGSTGEFQFKNSNGLLSGVTDFKYYTSTGNVGFGTTSASQKLHVVGNIKTHNVYARDELSGSFVLPGGEDINNYSIIGRLRSGYANFGSIDVSGDASVSGKIYASNGRGNSGEVLTSQGASGPSIWAPAVNVTVGSANSVLIKNSFNNFNYRLTFTDQLNNDIGQVTIDSDHLVYNPSTNRLGIGTTNPLTTLQVGAASTQVFVIDLDGNVGIGTTVPLDKLHIRNGGVYLVGRGTTIAFRTPDFRIYNTTSDTNGLSIDNYTSELVRISNIGNVGIGTTIPLGRLHVGAASSQAVVINSSGDVGIGTTNPTQSKLHIVDSSNFSVGSGSSGVINYRSGLTIENSRGDAYIYLLNNDRVSAASSNLVNNGSYIDLSGKLDQLNTAANLTFGRIGAFKENNTSADSAGYLSLLSRPAGSPSSNLVEAVRIDSSQRVGIGTTNLISKLTVYGDTTVARFISTSWYSDILFQNSSGLSSSYGFIGYYNRDMKIYANSISAPTLIVAGSASTTSPGNVGINTSIPGARLDVGGDVKVSGVVTTSSLNVTNDSRFYGTINIEKSVTEKVSTATTFLSYLPISSGVLSIDVSSSTIAVGILTSSVTSWEFTGISTENSKATTITLIADSSSLITYGDSCKVNGQSVSGGVRWPGGIAPIPTDNEDIISFAIVRDNSGSIRVYGSISLNFS